MREGRARRERHEGATRGAAWIIITMSLLLSHSELLGRERGAGACG